MKNRQNLLHLYNKCKILINFKAIKQVLYIKAALMKIQVAKELFVLEIEQGHEAYVPPELTVDLMPLSFRFYDAILVFVQDLVSAKAKDLNSFKTLYRLNYHNKENIT